MKALDRVQYNRYCDNRLAIQVVFYLDVIHEDIHPGDVREMTFRNGDSYSCIFVNKRRVGISKGTFKSTYIISSDKQYLTLEQFSYLKSQYELISI